MYLIIYVISVSNLVHTLIICYILNNIIIIEHNVMMVTKTNLYFLVEGFKSMLSFTRSVSYNFRGINFNN